MKQAIHIFRKDIRYLRLEIAGLLSLTVLFAVLASAGWPSDLLEVAALYVVARLIHAEAIPGDRQFWLTRPYRPLSLCAAKLLFIVVFICLPVGIAQTVIALRMGFPLAQEIPGLIWTQVLIFFVGALPVTALAAVTEGLVPFVATVLILGVVALLAGTSMPAMFPRVFSRMPDTVEWMRSFVFGLAIVGLSVAILLWQYRDRRTLFSRLFGVIAFNAAMAFYLWLPASLPLKAETWFSAEPGVADTVRIAVDASRRRAGAIVVPGRRPESRNLRVPVPIVVSGFPRDGEARSDDLSISFEWPDLSWKPSAKPGVAARSDGEGTTILDALVQMDPALLAERSQAPLKVRGSVYITLFGGSQRRRISLKQGPVNVQDGLQCFSREFAGEVTSLVCRSFFNWPSRLVYAARDKDLSDFSNSIVSYSPFPSSLNLQPEERWAEPIKADEVDIVTKKPLAHFRRDFEVQGVRLVDFTNPPKAPPLPGQAAR